MTTIDPDYRPSRYRKCIDCGEEGLFGDRRWTRCPHCYWKSELEKLKPVSPLLDELAAARAKLSTADAEIANAQNAAVACEARFIATRGWWRKLFGVTANRELTALRKNITAAGRARGDVSRDVERLERDIRWKQKRAREVREQFARYRTAREKGLAQRSAAQTIREVFIEKSASASGYDRPTLRVRRKDYKRGNAVENLIGKRWLSRVSELFGARCFSCGDDEALTLDHYAVPKNEGGNFIVYDEGQGALRANIVLLCRSCNAAKGENRALHFFSSEEHERLAKLHAVLVRMLLEDREARMAITAWYDIPVGNLPRD